jgi:DNA helicase-2/ATP-dependent DNA helicase PcrA
MDFVTDLNPEQQKAVQIKGGPILILAGAGSGKTRVITYRIAYLVKKGYARPHNILAITFTNKAADEMRNRIAVLLRDEPSVWIRTFHSTCAKILRDSLIHNKGLRDIAGVTEKYTIYDEQDQASVIKDVLKELDLDTHDFSPSLVSEAINRYKENLIPSDVAQEEPMARIYRLYNKKLREYNGVDFDDLIMKTVELFEKDPPTLEYYQERFRHIMVDEYQDTNKAQYVFTKLLAAKYRNLCVVGDDDQSIYSWRGAELRNILDFEKDFPDTAVIKLEQNYRSTKTILTAASGVVQNNEYRKKKVLWCENEDGEKIHFFSGADAYTEAAYVARKIIEARLHGEDLKKIAVFYRINYQSRVFEECFVRFEIPYEVIGALKFYERAEIKNVLAYLRVLENSKDSVSVRRIINIPSRKIGYITVEKVGAYAQQHGMSLYRALHHVQSITGINRSTRSRITEFVRMMETFREMRGTVSLYDLSMRVVMDTGYLESFEQEKSNKDYIRRKNVEELLISIKDYIRERPEATLEDYLVDVSLRSDIDDWDVESDRVNLMTLHNAKGLEFDTVFITGVEDGLIPHYRSQDEVFQYEEERRLLYVGITRARKHLYLTRAEQRDTLRGGIMFTTVSPFLNEIPHEVFASVYDDAQ